MENAILEKPSTEIFNSDFISNEQLSREWGVSKRTLHNYRKQNLIRAYKPGGRIIYLRSELMQDILKFGYNMPNIVTSQNSQSI